MSNVAYHVIAGLLAASGIHMLASEILLPPDKNWWYSKLSFSSRAIFVIGVTALLSAGTLLGKATGCG